MLPFRSYSEVIKGATVSFDGGVGDAWACDRKSKESSSSVVLEANCMSNVVFVIRTFPTFDRTKMTFQCIQWGFGRSLFRRFVTHGGQC